MSIKLVKNDYPEFERFNRVYFYSDAEGTPHISNDILPSVDNITPFLFKSPSDNLEDIVKAFTNNHRLNRQNADDVIFINHLIKNGESPFVKVTLGSIKRAIFSSPGLIRQTLQVLKSLRYAGTNVKWEDYYIPITSESVFKNMFGTDMPKSGTIKFNIKEIRNFSKFLLSEVKNPNLSYVELCVLKEFLDTQSSIFEYVNQVLSIEQQQELTEGLAKVDNAVATMKQFEMFDLLHNIFEDVEDIAYFFNTYKSILPYEEYERIMMKFSCVPISSDRDFPTYVESVVSTNPLISTSLVRSFYNYIRQSFRNETVTEKVGFLGSIISLNTKHLTNLVSPEFIAAVVGAYTKNYSEVNKPQFEAAAVYIDKIIDLLDGYVANFDEHTDEHYKRLYARVTVLCNIIMASLHYGVQIDLNVQSELQLVTPVFAHNLKASSALTKIRDKISTGEGFNALMQTLDTKVDVRSESFEIKDYRCTKFLKAASKISQTHTISPITSVLLYGDTSPETLARINAVFNNAPAITSLFLDETFFKEKTDTVTTHPIYKYILDHKLLKPYQPKTNDSTSYEFWASTVHLFLQMPELWVLAVLVNLFGTNATYEYLGLTQYEGDLALMHSETDIEADLTALIDSLPKAPVFDYAVYFEPLTTFYKSNFNVWGDPETFRLSTESIAPTQIPAV